MRDRVVVVVLALILSGFAAAMLVAKGPLAGHQIISLTVSHGVHMGDLGVLGAWVAGLACCRALWRRD